MTAKDPEVSSGAAAAARAATASVAGQARAQLAQMTARAPRLEALREFVVTENASAVVLVAATLVALAWANSPWSASYEQVWLTELALRLGGAELVLDLRAWVNEGLMAFFFFVVGLEIRRELDMGELRERSRVAAPVLAALGGMVVPALIYLAVNAGDPTARGWGIVMGTDTAFALGVLTLVRGATPRLRTFLLTLVIVDDVVALSVIAVAYTQDLAPLPLLAALALFAVVLILRRAGVQHGIPYFLVALGLWLATLLSGVHATVAGVAIGLVTTAHPPSREQLGRAGAIWRLFREEPTPAYARSASRTFALALSPNERLQHLFHPWTSYVVVPLFALANAGVVIDARALRGAATSPITLGIVAGLVLGKLVGISLVSWLTTRPLLGGLPLTVPLTSVVGVASVAGIGFTVSLLIADISFEGRALEEAKLGILGASVVASTLAAGVFATLRRLPSSVRSAGGARVAPPIIDLSDPVDPTVDHLRGSPEAPVTLVEYGDFECPYCGRAERVVRGLLSEFDQDITFVFRHLPLDDVHPHAYLAAEAAEAAGAQGRFWKMHDLLFAHQDALQPADLQGYAAELGLDVERFTRDLAERRHALRIQRDVVSADDSGAAGTPTFFVNGRRHDGPPTLQTLAPVIARAAGRLP